MKTPALAKLIYMTLVSHLPDSAAILADPCFCIISSLSYGLFVDDLRTRDQPLLLHQDRLVAAANALDWFEVARHVSGQEGLEKLRSAIQTRHHNASGVSKPLATDVEKIRILVDKAGNVKAESSKIGSDRSLDYPKRSFLPDYLYTETAHDNLCQVYLDSVVTTPSVFTMHKTTFREPYDNARARANVELMSPTQAEVLLFNHDGEIMEASLSTPYFFRNEVWVTPMLKSGGNSGVSRRLALEQGLCKEDRILIGDLQDGEILWISNGVRGFVQAVLRLHSQP